MHVKKGDKVKVISGKDKGKTATILKAMPKIDMVLVEGINMKKKHQKPRKQGQKGQIIDVSRPIHISNVAKAK